MANVLITPTLLDSFDFAMTAPPSWKERAMTGFLQKLRREKAHYPAWVGKGITFENAVYKACKVAKAKDQDEVTEGTKLFQKVCARCFDGNYQSVAKKTIYIAGEEVRFWGKEDVRFPEKIVDIKTTLNYKGEQKYLNGHQHLIYCWCDDVKEFEYIVAEWENEHSDLVIDVHSIPYTITDMRIVEAKIIAKVETFFGWLRVQDLWDDYYRIFSKNS